MLQNAIDACISWLLSHSEDPTCNCGATLQTRAHVLQFKYQVCILLIHHIYPVSCTILISSAQDVLDVVCVVHSSYATGSLAYYRRLVCSGNIPCESWSLSHNERKRVRVGILIGLLCYGRGCEDRKPISCLQVSLRGDWSVYDPFSGRMFWAQKTKIKIKIKKLRQQVVKTSKNQENWTWIGEELFRYCSVSQSQSTRGNLAIYMEKVSVGLQIVAQYQQH